MCAKLIRRLPTGFGFCPEVFSPRDWLLTGDDTLPEDLRVGPSRKENVLGHSPSVSQRQAKLAVPNAKKRREMSDTRWCREKDDWNMAALTLAKQGRQIECRRCENPETMRASVTTLFESADMGVGIRMKRDPQAMFF